MPILLSIYDMLLILNVNTALNERAFTPSGPEVVTVYETDQVGTHPCSGYAVYTDRVTGTCYAVDPQPINSHIGDATVVDTRGLRVEQACCVFHLGPTLLLSFLHIMLSLLFCFLIYV